MPPIPQKTSKRNDTGEFTRMLLEDIDGPIDLRGLPCRFVAKAIVNSVPVVIDSDAGDGTVIVEEDEAPNDIADRGWVRFEPSVNGVDASGLFECEVKVQISEDPPLILTWPSRKATNPHWQLDEDLPGA